MDEQLAAMSLEQRLELYVVADNQDAATSIVVSTSGLVFRRFWHNHGLREMAQIEDYMQECFLRLFVWAKQRNFRAGRCGAVIRVLCQAAQQTVASELRRPRLPIQDNIVGNDEGTDALANIPAQQLDPVRESLLNELLAQLKTHNELAHKVYMSVIDGHLTQVEVARCEGLSDTTTHRLFHYALTWLVAHWNQESN